jgi:hypothetical protein
MASAFRDTLFAYILRSAFGSRVLRHEDEKSLPTIWQEKLSTQTSPRDSAETALNDAPRSDAASSCSGPTQCADAPKKLDAEKGNDTLLVEWYGPTDPDVSYHSVMLVHRLLTSIVITPESAELVEWEEGMGGVPDVSFDIHRIHRICHLHCWNPLYHGRVPREQCRCDSGPRTLRRRLWTWLVLFSIIFFPMYFGFNKHW